MFQEGSIIFITDRLLLTNDIRLKGVKQFDRAKKRPAVVVGEDSDYFYYVTMSSKKGRFMFSYDTDKYITPQGKIIMLSSNRTQYIEIRNIYKHVICGFAEIDCLEEQTYLELLKSLKKYHTEIGKNKVSEWDCLEPLVDQQITKLQSKKTI